MLTIYGTSKGAVVHMIECMRAELEPHGIIWVMGVNLGGTINGNVTLLPRIKSHGEGGHIVNTASMSGD